MTQAPIGAVLSYWLRPTPERAHIHRIEVEHALYLAAANQEQIKDTLTEIFRHQTAAIENISFALDALRDEIAAGFSTVVKEVARVDQTLHQGFYQLHLDELGTHAKLDDILSCLLDKDSFQRELAARRAVVEARHARYQASSVFADAMNLTKRALNESNIAKTGAMLNEAIVLFGRASLHADFELEAHFQLGYLEQQHRRNINAAYGHYSKALGPTFSPHFVRTSRHIAHLDYLTGHSADALARMQSLIDHDEAITAFASDLQIANNQPWDNDACILALEDALARHKPLLKQSSRLSEVRRQFDDQRRFTATERFMESCSLIIQELHALRPDMQVYYDAARYAIGANQSSLAVLWLKHCHDAQPTVNARRAFLLEAMAGEELRKYEAGTFLRQAWAASETESARIAKEVKDLQQKIASVLPVRGKYYPEVYNVTQETNNLLNQAINELNKGTENSSKSALALAQLAYERAGFAREALQKRKNARSMEYANEYGANGFFLGVPVMGFAGCVSCLNYNDSHHSGIGDMLWADGFNLITGVLIGAIGGALIGAIIGALKGQNET